MKRNFLIMNFKALIRLILLNQYAVRLYIEFCVFERFQFDSIFQISCQNFDFSPNFSKLYSDSTFSRLYYFTITISIHFETSVVANYNMRLSSNHVNKYIDVMNFDHKDITFFCFYRYLLRILLLKYPLSV